MMEISFKADGNEIVKDSDLNGNFFLKKNKICGMIRKPKRRRK